jgi:hypothetical protein
LTAAGRNAASRDAGTRGPGSPAAESSKLPAVNRTTRWLLPTVLVLLLLGALVGAALH